LLAYLALDEPVAETIPAWSEDPVKSQITIRQLLHLTAGFDTQIGRAPSFEDALEVPLAHDPDEGFRYGPAAFQVFGAVLERGILHGHSLTTNPL